MANDRVSQGGFSDVTRDVPEEQTDVTMSGSAPSERLNPSFRKEDEHMAEELKPLVMAPPSYASPDPNTTRAGLVTVEESPLDLSSDYGQPLRDAVSDGESDVVGIDTAQSSRTPEELLQESAADKTEDAPEDRKEWSKANWQDQARAYGLAVGGDKATVQKRVEQHEKAVESDKEMQAAEWVAEVEKAKDADALNEIGARYDAAGADYSTVGDAMEKKRAEFAEADNQ